jgi:endonuclease/exonuclease/phosphatase family metal-dependent hydrolase
MNVNELSDYVNEYNKLFSTNHNIQSVIHRINDMKSYKNKLYKKEYTRHGEIQHIENFCLNSTYDKNMLNIPPKKDNVVRLISYNIHSSIQTCNIYETTDTGYFQNTVTDNDTNNTFNIITFLKDIDADIMCFQEYSPISTYIEKAYRLKNFMNLYNQYGKYQGKHIQSYISTFLDDASLEIKNLQTFLGNMIMSNMKLYEGGSFNTFSKYNSEGKRGHVYSKINLFGNDVYVFCVHPSAEGNPFIQYNLNNTNKTSLDYDNTTKDNKVHIDGILEFIKNNLKLDPKSIPIIIAGDFNTDKKDHLKCFDDNYFINSKSVYNDTDEYKFTGYHEAYIDNIFLSYGFMSLYQINFSHVLNIGYSDHFPILMEIQKKDEKYIKQFESFSKARGDLFSPLLTSDLNTYIQESIKSNFVNYEKFLVENNYHNSIVIVPKGTYLIHSTNAIAFPNWDVKPFELQEDKHPETNLWTKSTVLAHTPIESFSGYYGHLDEISMKRFVIYKVKRDLPLLNLYNFNNNSTNIQTRHLARMDFYKNLLHFIKKNSYIPISY